MERNTKAVEASRLVRPSVWVWTGDLVGHPGRTGPVSADGDGDGAELRKTAGLGCSGTAPQPPDCERTLLFQTGTRDPEGSSERGRAVSGFKMGESSPCCQQARAASWWHGGGPAGCQVLPDTPEGLEGTVLSQMISRTSRSHRIFLARLWTCLEPTTLLFF